MTRKEWKMLYYNRSASTVFCFKFDNVTVSKLNLNEVSPCQLLLPRQAEALPLDKCPWYHHWSTELAEEMH